MKVKLVKIISLLLIISLVFPSINLLVNSRALAAESASIDRKTVYKGLLITGVLIIGIKMITGDDEEAKEVSDEVEVDGDYDKDELFWLAKAVHAEARGEPFKGQIAVAAVILNRVKDEQFPDSVYNVIFQKNQFTSVRDGQIHLEASQKAHKAAKRALNGEDPSRGALYFYNPKTARHQSWFKTREVTVKIGQHVFAK